MRWLFYLPVESRGCLLPPSPHPGSFLHSRGLCTVWTPWPMCLSSIHTPAGGNPGHPIGLRCLNTVRGALCGRQDPYGRPCSEERHVWMDTVRGALCGRQDPYGRPRSEERRVGPGSAYRAISKVQEASCEKSQPTSLQGASCPCLRMTWICH